MAVNFKFNKKTAGTEEGEEGGNEGAATQADTPSEGTNAVPSWMKRGSAADEELDKHEKQAAARRGDGRMRRFFIKDDQRDVAVQVTFLDGDLTDPDADVPGQNKVLDAPHWYEHEVRMGPRDIRQFVCLEAAEGSCALCNMGNTRSYVGALTIIDHREIQTQRGPVQHEKKLFAFKPTTKRKLLKLAKKHGGLRGLVIEIQRSKDQNAPRVGDEFTVEGQITADAIKQQLDPDGKKGLLEPTNYSEEAPFYTGAQLVEIGVVAASSAGSGSSGGGSGGGAASDDIPF